MGIWTLLILAGMEVFWGAWTLIRETEVQKREKNRLMVSALQWGILALILLLPIGNKGLRFGGAFLIMSIRLLIAGGKFMRSRHGKHATKTVRKQGTGRPVASTIWGCLLTVISLFPALAFTGYQGLPTSGAYAVSMVSAILTDESRLETFEEDGSHREVPIYVYYPDGLKAESARTGKNDTEKFPLVFFSHGAFGYYQSNASTYLELASNGFIVISMEHPYHSIFTKDTAGKTILADRGFLQDAMRLGNAEDGTIPEGEIFRTSREWMNLRIADMRFVIDEVRKQASGTVAGEALEQAWYIKSDADARTMKRVLSMMDTDKIGVMGHSMGGATSVTIGRLYSDLIDAVIDIDGTMLGEQLSYENGVYQYPEEPYPVPLLAINNEAHQRDYEKYGTLYVNGAVLANAKDARYTYVKGSGHMNYTDLPLFSPFLSSLLGTGNMDAKKCMEITNGMVLQFFTHYLKGTGELQILDAYE